MNESKLRNEQPEVGTIMTLKDLPIGGVFKKVKTRSGEQFRFKDSDGKAYPAIKEDTNFKPQFQAGVGEVVIKENEQVEVVGYIHK